MLAGVTVTCFLLSYVVVLAMEMAKFVGKVPARKLLMVGMMVAGLIAHSVFLINQFSAAGVGGDGVDGAGATNWFHWSVIAAWGLAIACLILMLRNPEGSMGLFLIPLILALIGLGQLLRDTAPFQSETTITVWWVIHSVSQLLGTMFICFGVAFGVMYLVQSHRLKSKKRRVLKLRLPTLEFLQSMNRLSIFSSCASLGLGMLSGIVLNLFREGAIAWFSSGIIFSLALFLWSLFACVVELTARGSLGGRRSAYLVIGNFVFMTIVLGIVLLSAHGQPAAPTAKQIQYEGSQGSISTSMRTIAQEEIS